MPLVFSHPQRPPEGHYFPDESGVTLRADTLAELLDKVAAYRRVNNLHPGNPYSEVEKFYAVKFPWLVSKVGIAPENRPDPVGLWLQRVWQHAPQSKDFVETEKRDARRKACEACEHYAPDHPFSTDQTRKIMLIGAGKNLPMGACKVRHWACGLAAVLASGHPAAGASCQVWEEIPLHPP